jgi:hypothetical protein
VLSLCGDLTFGEVSDLWDCARFNVELRVGPRAEDRLPAAARGIRELELADAALNGVLLADEPLAADESEGEKISLARTNWLETLVSTMSFGLEEVAE